MTAARDMERFANIKASINVSEARAQIKDLQKEAQEARDIIRNTSEIMTARSKNLPENETFKKLTEDIKKAEEQYRRLNYELYQLERPKANTDAETLADFRQKCQEAKEELRRLEEERERYNRGELNKRITPEQDETYLKARQTNADATARLGRIENEIRGQQAQIDTYNDANSAMQRLRASVSTTRAEMRAMQDETHKSSSAIKILSTVVKGIGTGFTGAFAFKDLKKGFSDIGKSITGTLGRITARIRRVAVTMAIRRAIRSVVQGLKEGIGYYIGWDKAMNAQVSALKNSLTELKGNLGGAFAPILEIVVPALQQFVGWLTTAVNAVGAFIARLTGKNTYKSVVAGTASEGRQAAQSIGNATDKVRELKKELAHYDELNVISKDDDTSGSGGGSGGGGGSATGTGLQYQDTAIGDSIKDFADKIKEAWAKADFTEIGNIIGGKLRDALNNIPWESIQETCRKVAKSLATLLNGFFETEGLAQAVGNALGQGLNTLTTSLHEFLANLHTDSIGKFLTEGIWEAFKSFDFVTLGQLVSDIPKKIYNFLQGAIEGIPWKEVPSTIIQKIVDFFKGYDFKGIAEAIGGLLGAGLRAAVDLVGSIWDLLQEAWGDMTSYFSKYIEDAGGNVVKGIFNGIVNALKNIGTWIKENLWDPFINAFKNAFGIHSPSTKMEEYGEYIVEGVLNGIKKIPEKLKEVASWIWEQIKAGWKTLTTVLSVGVEMGVDAAKKFAEWTKDKAVKLVVEAKEKVKGALQKLKTAWEGIKETTKKLLTEAKEKVKGALSAMKTAWEGLKDKAVELVAEAKERVAGALDALADLWGGFKNKVATLTAKAIAIGKTALSGLADVWSGIKEKTKELITKAKVAGRTILEKVASAWDGLKAGTKNLITKAQEAVGHTIAGLKKKWTDWTDTAKELFVEAKERVAGTLASLKSAWNTGWSAAKSLVVNVAENFLGWLKKIFPLGKDTPNDLNANVILDIVAGWVGTLQEWFNDITGGGKVKANVELEEYDEKKGYKLEGENGIVGIDGTVSNGSKTVIKDGKFVVEVEGKFTPDGKAKLQSEINKSGYTADITDANTDKVPQRGRTLGHGMLNLEDTDDKTTSEMRTLDNGGVHIRYADDRTDGTTEVKAKGSIWTAFDKTVEAVGVKAKGLLKEAYDRTKGDTEVKAKGGIATAKDKTDGTTPVKVQGDATKINDKAGGKDSVKVQGDATKINDKAGGKDAVKVQGDAVKVNDKAGGKDSVNVQGNATKIHDKAGGKDSVNVQGNATKVHDKAGGKDSVSVQGNATKIHDKSSGKDTVNVHGNATKAIDKTSGKDTVNVHGNVKSAKDGTRGDTKINSVANLHNRAFDPVWNRKSLGVIPTLANFTKYRLSNEWKNNGYNSISEIASFYKWKKDWHSSWNEVDEIANFYKWNRGWHSSWNYIDMIANFVSNKALGGILTKGAWKNLPQYAGGGSPTHGTVFLAGESGAEVVGTVGGRTEVLNKSQIAMAIYNAVRSAMQGFGMDIVKQIAYDSSVLSAHIDAVATYIPDVNHITQANRIYAKAEGIDYNRLAQALAAQGGDNNTYVFTAQLDGREIFRETVSQNDLYRTQTGRSAFA